MKKNILTAGAASSALLLGVAGMALANGATADNQVTDNAEPQDSNHVLTLEEADYVKVANLQGTFTFNQDGVTPNDDLFNVFGTAITSMCSKPANELVAPGTHNAEATYFINVGGNIKKSFTVNLAEMEDQSVMDTVACSCATGAPFGQAAVVGVPLAAVVNMAELDEGVNTLTAYGTDGFGEPMPLRYALEHDAMLVYEVNGERLQSTEGPSAQLWMPETVARYFTRNIVDIKLTAEKSKPDMQSVDPMWRNKVEIMNSADGCVFLAGNSITFEGVADDLGSPIEAVEFSFDGGQTWTECSTEGATADRWVNWRFETSFDQAGDYKMIVRARTADGVVSPVEASLTFHVI